MGLLSGTATITEEDDNDAAKRADERNKGVVFKSCASFTDCLAEINNTPTDNAKIWMFWCQCKFNKIQYLLIKNIKKFIGIL